MIMFLKCNWWWILLTIVLFCVIVANLRKFSLRIMGTFGASTVEVPAHEETENEAEVTGTILPPLANKDTDDRNSFG